MGQGANFMNWLYRQRVRRAVLLASTALNKANNKNRSNRSRTALDRPSVLRRKVLFEAMEPKLLLSTDPVIAPLSTLQFWRNVVRSLELSPLVWRLP
jgi:hypothetical protein